jgi:glutathione S-transferase
MSWCASGIHPFLARINAPRRVCDPPDADENVRKLAAAQLYENYQIADDWLAGREYFFDQFTAATPISSGASVVANSSNSIWPGSQIARQTLHVLNNARAFSDASFMRKPYSQNLPRLHKNYIAKAR